MNELAKHNVTKVKAKLHTH